MNLGRPRQVGPRTRVIADAFCRLRTVANLDLQAVQELAWHSSLDYDGRPHFRDVEERSINDALTALRALETMGEFEVRVLMLCQQWEESEHDWGTRADGYSLHIDREARDAYVADVRRLNVGPTPDICSRPCGEPYDVEVNTTTMGEDCDPANDNGYRIYDIAPDPPHGARGVWRHSA